MTTVLDDPVYARREQQLFADLVNNARQFAVRVQIALDQGTITQRTFPVEADSLDSVAPVDSFTESFVRHHAQLLHAHKAQGFPDCHAEKTGELVSVTPEENMAELTERFNASDAGVEQRRIVLATQRVLEAAKTIVRHPLHPEFVSDTLSPEQVMEASTARTLRTLLTNPYYDDFQAIVENAPPLNLSQAAPEPSVAPSVTTTQHSEPAIPPGIQSHFLHMAAKFIENIPMLQAYQKMASLPGISETTKADYAQAIFRNNPKLEKIYADFRDQVEKYVAAYGQDVSQLQNMQKNSALQKTFLALSQLPDSPKQDIKSALTLLQGQSSSPRLTQS